MSTQKERRAMLESMQIKGIRWMIWQHIGEENAKERLLGITNQSSIADIKKFVDSQNRETLIKLIDNSPEISPQIIESAYDKYRYGLRPGFTLFWVKRKDRIQLTKEELETRMASYFDEIKYGESAKSMNVKCHGETMTFMGIAKSVITGKSKKITLSSGVGREIIQQALTAFYDARVDIVGVIYPDLIEDQLKYFLSHGELYYQVQQFTNKKRSSYESLVE